MVDTTLKLRFEADGTSQVVGAAKQVEGAVGRLPGSAQRAGAGFAGLGRAGARAGDQVERSTARATQSVDTLAAAARAAARVLGASIVGTAIIRIGDQYQQLNSRIRQVVDSEEQLAATRTAVAEIAQRTRQQLSATTELYTRLTVGTEALNLSEQQRLRITESFGQALAISGAAQAEAASATLQFTQALSSGVLRGEEFNAVSEAAPRIMQLLADRLGVTRGELRGLAEDGKISADLLAGALLDGAAKLDAEFARIGPTVAGSLQQASNSLLLVGGELLETTGVTGGLVATVQLLTQTIEDVPAALEDAREVFGLLTADQDSFATLFLGNLDLIGFAAGDVGQKIIDTFMLLPQSARTGFSIVIGELDKLRAQGEFAFQVLLAAGDDQFLALAEVVARFVGESDRLFGVLVDRARDRFIDLGQIGARALSAASFGEQAAALRVYTLALGQLGSEEQRAIARGNERVANVQAQREAIMQSVLAAEAQRDAEIALSNESIQTSLTELRAAQARLASGRASEAAREAVEGLTGATTALTGETEDNAEATKRQAREQEQARRALLGLTADFGRLERQLAEQLGGDSVRAANDYADALALIAEYEQQILALGPPTLEQTERIAAARAAAAERLTDDTERDSQEWARYWEGATASVTDAFADFLTGGIDSFEDFGDRLKDIARGIISDLISSFVQSKLTIPIQAAVTGAGGAGGGLNGILGSILGGGNGGGVGGLITGIGGAIGSIFGTGGAISGAATSLLGPLGGLASLAGPIAGIAAALGVVNSLTGGGLFGGSVRGSASGVRVGAGGGDAFASERVTRSLFRGTRSRNVDPGDEARAAANELYEAALAALTEAARAVGGEVPALVGGEFRREFDKKGNLQREFGTIAGRVYNEGAEAFQQRLVAENILAGIGSVFAEVGQIANRWRGDAAELLSGSQFLLAAATDIRTGTGLLGDDLGTVAGLVEGLRTGTEGLIETYARVSGGIALLDEALQLSGVSLDLTREELIRFAADITTAAGGLDRATGLWQTYFATFYDDQERALLAIERAQTNAGAQFSDLGLTAADFAGAEGAAAFRALFESALPGLSAEAVVEYLEAAEALGLLLDMQTQYGELVGNQAGDLQTLLAGVQQGLAEFAGPQSFADRIAAVESEIADLITRATELGATEADIAQIRELSARRLGAIAAEQAAAVALYDAEAQGIRDALDALTLTPFQQSLQQIERDADAARARLNELARAAGLAGAAAEDLARVEQLVAIRRAQAIAQLEQSARGLVEQLYGTPISRIEDQIRGLESVQQNALGGIAAVSEASDKLYERQRAAAERIGDFYRSLLLGPLSGNRPSEALAAAQTQFAALSAAALGGDVQALEQVPQLAEALLRLVGDVFGGSAPGDLIRDQVLGQLQQLAALTFNAPATPGVVAGPNAVQVAASPELAQLYIERDRLLAEQTAQERLRLAQELSGLIGELISATGDPLQEVAERLGVGLEDLVRDLGVNLDELSVDQAQRLASLAQTLGVSLSEVTAGVGVDLGLLADRQSLLNDALEERILDLPEGQRDELLPLFRSLEDAASPEEVEARLQSLRAAVLGLPDGLQGALAPFFGLSPPDWTQLSALTSIDIIGQSQLAEMVTQTELLRVLAEAASPQALDALAKSAPLPIEAFAPANDALAGEVRALRAEVSQLRAELAAVAVDAAAQRRDISSAQREGAREIATATDRQTSVLERVR